MPAPLSVTLSSTDGTATSVAALRASIEVAKSGRRDASHAAAVLALLERQGDSFEAWRERVRSLVRSARAFRETVVTPEDLLRVIEDPAATPEQRVGATMALSAYDGTSCSKPAYRGCYYASEGTYLECQAGDGATPSFVFVIEL